MLRRRLPLAVLALAIWFAAEPLVHTHPIWSSSGSSSTICAVCSTGVDRPVAAPDVPAPLDVIAVVDDAPVAVHCAVATLLLASRAPPAA